MKNKPNPKLVKLIAEELDNTLPMYIDEKTVAEIITSVYQISEKWRKEGIEEILKLIKEAEDAGDQYGTLYELIKLKQKK